MPNTTAFAPSPPPADKAPSTRARRWAWAVALAVGMALALVLVFVLALTTNNRDLYEKHYPWLFALNVLIAAALALVLLWAAARLLLRWRQQRFGSRLLLKLAAIFALVGLLPGLMIYGVSYQFVAHSIESWFDVKVERALEAGVNLGSTALDTLAADALNRTRQASQQLIQPWSWSATSAALPPLNSAPSLPNNASTPSRPLAMVPDAVAPLVIERLREQLDALDLVLWNSTASAAIASAGSSLLALTPQPPSAQQLRSLRESAQHIPATLSIEGLEEWDEWQQAQAKAATAAHTPPASAPAPVRVRILLLVRNPQVGLLAQPRYLQATIALPPALVANALAVQQAHREYQSLALSRQGLQRMYIATLTLSLFLAVIGALLLAVLLGNQLARPLLLLAQGVRDVASGDLRPKAVSFARDELGGLTRSFASMTRQLLQAQTAAHTALAQARAARAQLHTVVDSLSTGVLVLDAQDHIVLTNPAASRILRTPLQNTLHHTPALTPLAQLVAQQFALWSQPGPQPSPPPAPSAAQGAAASPAHSCTNSPATQPDPHPCPIPSSNANASSPHPSAPTNPPPTAAPSAQGADSPDSAQAAWFAPPAPATPQGAAAFAQQLTPAPTPSPHWQQVLEYWSTRAPEGSEAPSLTQDKITLVVRGALLPAAQGADSTASPAHTDSDLATTTATTAHAPAPLRLVVFDDISAVVSAQRTQAWGEVARRVAHEIKNPLTPIQLSAQRLQMRLADKLPEAEQALLNKSVHTIVEQVAAMLRLVNEFRDYARLPPAQLRPLDLNALLQDILPLYAEGSSPVRVLAQLDAACPPIAGDAQQLRQVIHNLIQNAQDATLQRWPQGGNDKESPPTGAEAGADAPVPPPPPPPVLISTQWLPSAHCVRLMVSDSGSGFAPHILQRAFEPYVTTKAKGTGLGLAIVRKIADEHSARIDIANRNTPAPSASTTTAPDPDGPPLPCGAQVSLSFTAAAPAPQQPPQA